MGISGNMLRDAIVKYIASWSAGLAVKTEVNLGMRFMGTPRRIDLLVYNPKNNKAVGIECKLQQTSGTAYEKFNYALEDCLASPIPTLLVFAGNEIRMDMRSKLILSGIGIEVGYRLSEDGERIECILDPGDILQQRILMELDLNWFDIASGTNINYEKDYGDAHISVRRPDKRKKKSEHFQQEELTRYVAEDKDNNY